jgi:hypothetical protein
MARDGPCEDQTPVSRGACCETHGHFMCEEGYHKHVYRIYDIPYLPVQRGVDAPSRFLLQDDAKGGDV